MLKRTRTHRREHGATQCHFTSQPEQSSQVNTILKTAPHTEEDPLRGFISSKRDRLLNKVCVYLMIANSLFGLFRLLLSAA